MTSSICAQSKIEDLSALQLLPILDHLSDSDIKSISVSSKALTHTFSDQNMLTYLGGDKVAIGFADAMKKRSNRRRTECTMRLVQQVAHVGGGRVSFKKSGVSAYEFFVLTSDTVDGSPLLAWLVNKRKAFLESKAPKCIRAKFDHGVAISDVIHMMPLLKEFGESGCMLILDNRWCTSIKR